MSRFLFLCFSVQYAKYNNFDHFGGFSDAHSIPLPCGTHIDTHTHTDTQHCKLLLIKIACGNACIQFMATKGVYLCILVLPHSIHLAPLTLYPNTISVFLLCPYGNCCSVLCVQMYTQIRIDILDI